MSKKLTRTQKKVLLCLSSYIEEHGYPPTNRELAAILGIKGPSVHEHLKKMEDKGVLKRTKNRARSIEILDNNELSTEENSSQKELRIPVIGSVAAGSPIFATENYSGDIVIDGNYTGRGNLFALKVKGESMINAGINNGDYVVVRQQPVVDRGEIALALIGNEATIKRLQNRNGQILLLPENPAFSPIDVTHREDFRILGKVIHTVTNH